MGKGFTCLSSILASLPIRRHSARDSITHYLSPDTFVVRNRRGMPNVSTGRRAHSGRLAHPGGSSMRSLLVFVAALLLATASLLPARVAAQDAPAPDSGTPIPPIPWQLTTFPGATTPFAPLDYTIQFVPDGTINIHADCNWMIGV